MAVVTHSTAQLTKAVSNRAAVSGKSPKGPAEAGLLADMAEALSLFRALSCEAKIEALAKLRRMMDEIPSPAEAETL